MNMIIITILLLSVLVVFHEFGHFIVAKKVGIEVEEFSVGFGKKLFSKKKGETVYSLRALPLGGYVKLAGMEDGDVEYERGFNKKPIWQRMLTLFMGPFMNFFLAVIFLALAFMSMGVPVSLSEKAEIGDTFVGYPADLAGLKPGDQINEINGEKVFSWEQVTKIINNNPEKPLRLLVKRDNQIFDITVTPKNEKEKGIIGIAPKIVMNKLGFFESIKEGFLETIRFTLLIITSLGQMIMGKVSPDLVGPVGMTKMVGHAASMGIGYLLRLAGILSVNLGLLNLFPFPALDGGRILFLGIEAIRRKPINPERENLIHLVGFGLLMLLIVFTTYSDLIRFKLF